MQIKKIPFSLRNLTATALVASFLLACPTAEAKEKTQSPFSVDPWIDVPLLLTSSLLWGIPELVEPRRIEAVCNPCNPEDVNLFDRWAIELYRPNARLTSDILSGVLFTATGILTLMNLPDFGWQGIFEDIIILGHALTIKGVLFQMVSRTVQRPRPVLYRDDIDEDVRYEITSYRSFFSGHTATAFSAATSLSFIYSLRHPESRIKYWVWAISHAAASAIAYLRITSGRHFPSDVLVGTVVGVSAGLMAPAIHRVPDKTKSGNQHELMVMSSGVGYRLNFK